MPIKVCPTAEGFGRHVTGGRNGLVLFINSLTDAESRNVWQGSYERMIIPRVSGYVELTSNLNVSYGGRSNFTYLGFLAPGELVYKNWEVRISSVSNIIIRGLKSRPGDRNKEVSTISGDSFALAGFSGNPNSNNFYIDHSVGSWSTDEVFSLAGAFTGTVQYCLFYEPLHSATINEKFGQVVPGQPSPHGFGHIFGAKDLSFHHNLHAFMDQRVPLLQNNGNLVDDIMDFRNNAYYAWHSKGFEASRESKSVNFIKNSFIRKINYTGNTPTAFARFTGETVEESPRIYLQGNKYKTWNGSAFVDVIAGLTDDPLSQRQGLSGTNGTNTTNLRNIVGVLTQFPIPVGTYSFNETVEQSDLAISVKAGTLRRDPVDRRVVNDWLTGAVPIQGGTTGIWGLIDKPEDSKHLGSNNVGYAVIESREQVLNGPAPHYLPNWFISKYNLNNFGNYHLAGNSVTRPENFIRFRNGVGIQLSQDTSRGIIDHENDLIYRGYEVLAFHETGEINLLETTHFVLTVNAVNGGTSNIVSESYAPSSTVNLIATPNVGFAFTRWEIQNNSTLLWETIGGASANFGFLMPSANATVRPVFTAIPTFTLSVSSTGNGTTNISTATAIEGQSVALSAIPNSGYRYEKWERLEGAGWIDLLALESFSFIMPSVNTQIRASFVLIDVPIPPSNNGKKLFKKRP